MTIESSKHVADGISLGTAFGTLIGVLPGIAALLSIIWSAIRIYESRTMQKLLGHNPKCVIKEGDFE